jgi:hypothetical protein
MFLGDIDYYFAEKNRKLALCKPQREESDKLYQIELVIIRIIDLQRRL